VYKTYFKAISQLYRPRRRILEFNYNFFNGLSTIFLLLLVRLAPPNARN